MSNGLSPQITPEFTTIKLKVGHMNYDELSTLATTLTPYKNSHIFRFDANRQWALADALKNTALFEHLHIDYIEEPTQDPNDQLRFFETTKINYAQDESPFVPQKGLKARIIKPSLMGSIHDTFKAIEEARIHGIQPILSSTYESEVGLSVIANIGLIRHNSYVPLLV